MSVSSSKKEMRLDLELYELKQTLETNKKKLKALGDSLDLAKLKEDMAAFEERQADEHFWDDPQSAQRLIRENNTKKELYDTYFKITKWQTFFMYPWINCWGEAGSAWMCLMD